MHEGLRPHGPNVAVEKPLARSSVECIFHDCMELESGFQGSAAATAGGQEYVSGQLIERGMTIVDGVDTPVSTSLAMSAH